MAAETDYYRVLGLQKGASSDEIRKAFRRIAKENHPDRNPDNAAAEQKFKEANEAYQVLSDDKKRKLYDTYGSVGLKEGFDPEQWEAAQRGFGGRGFSGGGGGGFGGFGGAGFDGQNIRFEDLFGGFAGGGGGGGFGGGFGRGTRQAPVEDTKLALSITFDKALHGTTTNFRYRRNRSCAHCKGQGGVGGTVCHECQGRGETTYQDEASVKIPQGARTGDVIRLAKRGNIDARGNAADLLMEIRVEEDPRFEPDGTNLTMETILTPSDLLLGGSHTLDGPWGPITLKLRPGMDPRQMQRIPERGMKRGKSQGDLYVRFVVQGETLTDAQQEAIQAILRPEDEEHAEDTSSGA